MKKIILSLVIVFSLFCFSPLFAEPVLTIGDNYIFVNSVGDIQSNIDYLESDGGGIVHILCGTYTLTYGISIEANDIILEGSGSCTVLKAANSSNINVITVGGNQTKRWIIRDMMINGNKSNNNSGSGIYVNITGSRFDAKALVENVNIINTKEEGYKEKVNLQASEIKLSNIYVEGADGFGFYLNGSDHKVSNCIAGNNKKCGFKNFGGNDQFLNCKAYGNDFNATTDTYANISIAGNRTQLVNCQAQDGWANGFYIGADDVLLVGCQADSNNKYGKVSGIFAGIQIGKFSDRAVIVGNKSFDRNETKQQDYGLIISNEALDNFIFGNNFEGNKTGAIYVTSQAQEDYQISYPGFP